MKPIVAIVGREITEAKGVRGEAYGAGRLYSDAITRAGGVPVIVPPVDLDHDAIASLISRCQGLVLHGGGDVDPARYGQEPDAPELYGINARHDDVELAVVNAALAVDLPILAICRGVQIMNVALGGTLVQHITTHADHTRQFHPVSLVDGSRTARAMGTTSPSACHSYHHQALDRLGDGVTVVGRHADGIIEAVEVDGHRWVVGVQWHPEDSAAADSQQQSLFDTLITTCSLP
ncbi:MAG: peptidase C26 [Acidimicrobiales bacterium mtb01]|nr:gamma-glutamyl-gamma-aminobutyrate hydrolase family protein [Actinomycetota bacterium]TEX48411.1 MAG: peptidase C26 [Acidimicrobiales bacterium mtb01]